ncbi:MAG: Uma2 family endonuclease [Bacteroidota bacterium]
MAIPTSGYPSSQTVIYPESDGKPMADNTRQTRWIIAFYNNLRAILRDRVAFVAADIFWYPVEGNPKIVVAPDVLVALGRPDGDRGSYKQWEEEGQPPDVVIEVLSLSNHYVEMINKLDFYNSYGVQEYLVIDPDREVFVGYVRKNGLLTKDGSDEGWTSPLLQFSIRKQDHELVAFKPDSKPFKTFEELEAEAEDAQQRYLSAQQEIERLKAALKDKDNKG